MPSDSEAKVQIGGPSLSSHPIRLVLVIDVERVVTKFVERHAGLVRVVRVHVDPATGREDGTDVGLGALVEVGVDPDVGVVPVTTIVDDCDALDQELAIGAVVETFGHLEDAIGVAADLVGGGVHSMETSRLKPMSVLNELTWSR